MGLDNPYAQKVFSHAVTETDLEIVLLLNRLQNLFPEQWSHFEAQLPTSLHPTEFKEFLSFHLNWYPILLEQYAQLYDQERTQLPFPTLPFQEKAIRDFQSKHRAILKERSFFYWTQDKTELSRPKKTKPVPPLFTTPSPPKITFSLLQAGESDYYSQKGRHRIRLTLTKPYLIGQTPITNRTHAQIFSQRTRNNEEPYTGISWYEALQFCNTLSRLHKRTPAYQIGFPSTNKEGERVYPVEWKRDANGYRLPTRAEWIYAAQGGQQEHAFSGGDDARLYAWTIDDNLQAPEPVATKHSNAYGLYDMSGNVWEWLWDGAYLTPEPPGEAHTDPTGPRVCDYRLLMGGSWRELPKDIYTHTQRKPNLKAFDIGFRIVLPLYPTPESPLLG